MGNVAVTIADTASKAAAAPVKAVTGGQGGTVVLIAGILFLGYLFLTRRLQAVARALQSPVENGAPQVSGGMFPRRGSLEEQVQREGGTPGIAPATVDPFAECVKYQMTVVGRSRAEAEAKCASQRTEVLPRGRFIR